jgi:hypothetical protein
MGRHISQVSFGWKTGLPDGTYIFIQKLALSVYFAGPWNGKCWNIYVEYFMAISYILWSFGIGIPKPMVTLQFLFES